MSAKRAVLFCAILAGCALAARHAGADPVPGITKAAAPLVKSGQTVSCPTCVTTGGGGGVTNPLTVAAWSSTTGLATITTNAVVSSTLQFNGGDANHSGTIRAYSIPVPTATPTLPGTRNSDYAANTGLYTDTGCTVPVTADGDAIACWHDTSGNNRDLVQATAGARPLYRVSINGRPAIQCDGVDDFLAETATNPVMGSAYVVSRYTAASTFNTYAGAFSFGAGGDGEILFTGNSSGIDWYSAAGRFNVATGSMFVDGAATFTMDPFQNTTHASIGTSVTPAAGSTGIQVCKDRANASRFFGGYIYAAGIYSTTLSGPTVASLNSALQTLWIAAPAVGTAGLAYTIPLGIGNHTFTGAVVMSSSLTVTVTIAGDSVQATGSKSNFKNADFTGQVDSAAAVTSPLFADHATASVSAVPVAATGWTFNVPAGKDFFFNIGGVPETFVRGVITSNYKTLSVAGVGTVTVPASSICSCTNTTSPTVVQCSVSGTTLSMAEPIALVAPDVIAYICKSP